LIPEHDGSLGLSICKRIIEQIGGSVKVNVGQQKLIFLINFKAKCSLKGSSDNPIFEDNDYDVKINSMNPSEVTSESNQNSEPDCEELKSIIDVANQ
jgi:hypothetical protein